MTAPRYLLDTNICIYIHRRQPAEVLVVASHGFDTGSLERQSRTGETKAG